MLSVAELPVWRRTLASAGLGFDEAETLASGLDVGVGLEVLLFWVVSCACIIFYDKSFFQKLLC